MAEVNPIPDHYHRVTPLLFMDGDAAAAIDFYCAVFDATVRLRLDGVGGRIEHAELQLGDSVIMLADEFPDEDLRGPRSIGGTPVSLNVYVEDVDAVFARALSAGATQLRAIEDQFYGDRSGRIEDPFGHRWRVASRIEDVPQDEIAEMAAQAASQR